MHYSLRAATQAISASIKCRVDYVAKFDFSNGAIMQHWIVAMGIAKISSFHRCVCIVLVLFTYEESLIAMISFCVLIQLVLLLWCVYVFLYYV